MITIPLTMQQMTDGLHAWADGSLPTRAAVDIVLTTSLVEVVAPEYLLWDSSPDESPDDSPGNSPGMARIDIDRLSTDINSGSMLISYSSEVLARVVINLRRGVTGAGAGLDLRDLWMLDDSNRRAVLDVLGDTLLSRAGFSLAHAK